MSEQAAAYVTTNWAANCGHPVCSATAVYWHGLHPDTQGELCPACAGEYLTRLYRQEADATLSASAFAGEIKQMRAAILALATRFEKEAIPQMGPRDITKKLRGIAGGE